MNIILGRDGNLANALKTAFPDSIIIGKDEYMSWLFDPNNAISYLKKMNLENSNLVLLNAVGIIDASEDANKIDLINFQFPQMLHNILGKNGVKIVTFGTIMEKFPRYCESNPYLFSKYQLNKFLTSLVMEKSSYLHIQMHTLYGGKSIHPFMFLGQIYDSLKMNKEFKMGNGIQIREYHHIEDEIMAIKKLISSNEVGVHHISHGTPIKLLTVAKYLFSYFGKENLLIHDSIESNPNDNINYVFQPELETQDSIFRDTFAGIVGWFSERGLDARK